MTKNLYKRLYAWMNYNPPGALSSKGWRLFDKEFKKNAPIRHWIKNDLKPAIVYPIRRKYGEINDWIRYRTYDRYHVIHTGLKPGYQSVDTQILNINFNMLKDFVECELAWCRFRWQDDIPAYKKIGIIRKYIRVTFRKPELGLDHLKWASTLDDPNLPPYERNDGQAVMAREIHALYDWWVNIRPFRECIEVPIYSRKEWDIIESLDEDSDQHSPEYKKFEEAITAQHELDEQWHIEDDDMLIRLIKIRRSLWT